MNCLIECFIDKWLKLHTRDSTVVGLNPSMTALNAGILPNCLDILVWNRLTTRVRCNTLSHSSQQWNWDKNEPVRFYLADYNQWSRLFFFLDFLNLIILYGKLSFYKEIVVWRHCIQNTVIRDLVIDFQHNTLHQRSKSKNRNVYI